MFGVIAMLIFLIYQPLDAAGHLASEVREGGNNSVILRAISAFDVLDDSLDGAPDRDHLPAVQQQTLTALPSWSPVELAVLVLAVPTSWPISSAFLLPNQILSELFRPPRD